MIVNRLEKEGALASAQRLGISTGEITTALLGQGSALDDLRAKLRDTAAQGTTFTSSVEGVVVGQSQASVEAEKLLKLLDGESAALAEGAQSNSRMTEATTAAAAATKEHTKSLKDQIDALRETSQAQLALSGSQIGLESAYDAATAAAKKNGKTLDITTEKGRANRTALDAIATAGLSVADSLNKVDPSGKKAGRAMEDARAKFIKVATSMTGSSKKAKELADKLLGIPKKVDSHVNVKFKGPDVKKEILAIQARVNANPLYIPAKVNGVRVARAYGGRLPGSAPHDRADNMLYAGTPGEWVIQKPTARYYGDSIMAALNAGRIPKERLVGYAYGGKLGPTPAASREHTSSPENISAADIEAAVMRGVRSGLAGAGIRFEGVSRLADSVSARILAAST